MARRPYLSADDRERCTTLALALERYYREYGRAFPWRTAREPYRLAVAELLLQKTRAASVTATYENLLERFPDALALSLADVDDLERSIRHLVLSRKRSVHLKNLGTVLTQTGTGILANQEAALALPGLWRYGARAVACFAFGKPVGIVDANVRRVFARVFSLRNTKSERIHTLADAVASAGENAAAVNYGLLDVGAVLCKRVPRCNDCPLLASCKYAAKRKVAV